jgi:hypothetical protein
MTPEQQRIVIAEACGWKNCRVESIAGQTRLLGKWPLDSTSSDGFSVPPDYLNDLNAMHDAEKTLTNSQWVEYGGQLRVLCDRAEIWSIHATASQRAEAFLKTLDL